MIGFLDFLISLEQRIIQCDTGFLCRNGASVDVGIVTGCDDEFRTCKIADGKISGVKRINRFNVFGRCGLRCCGDRICAVIGSTGGYRCSKQDSQEKKSLTSGITFAEWFRNFHKVLLSW